MNTDTTVTTDENGAPDDASALVADSQTRKPHPLVYLGLGIALVAMGQEFIEDGFREARRRGLPLPNAFRTQIAFSDPVRHLSR